VIGELISQSRKAIRLPHVADLFPDMVDASLDAKDDKPSCSVAEALQKQSLVINNTMANEVFNLLWMLFRNGKLNYSGKFINLETGVARPDRPRHGSVEAHGVRRTATGGRKRGD